MTADRFDSRASEVAFEHVAGLTWRALLLKEGAVVDILECDDANRLADMVLGAVCPNEFKMDLNAARRKKRMAMV